MKCGVNMISVDFYQNVNDDLLKYAVIMARYNDSWIFCKHKDRTSYEIAGGHRELGESIYDTAKRELEEETGAISYNLKEVSIYGVNRDGNITYGMLFYAEIFELGQLKYEIDEIVFNDTLPYELTYKDIQPKLFNYVCKSVSFKTETTSKKQYANRLYRFDNECYERHLKALKLCQEFNETRYNEFDKRKDIIKELFGGVKENYYLEPTIHCDYGCNVFLGNNFYANFDTIFLDVNTITFGDNVFVAPRCSFYTAGHPIDKDVRNEGLEYGYPIRVGNDVWIGGNTVVNPGVTIGDNVVIGSGSVVTKDIPSGVVAAGNPCKVIRKITEEDKKIWEKQRKQFENNGE